MNVEKIKNRIPYFISIVFVLNVAVQILTGLNLHWYLNFTNPCEGNPVCVVDARPIDVVDYIQPSFVTLLVVLLVLQLIVQLLYIAKKKTQ